MLLWTYLLPLLSLVFPSNLLFLPSVKSTSPLTLPLLSLFLLPSIPLSSANIFAPPSAFSLRTTMSRGADKRLRRWVRKGAKMRVDIFLRWGKELGMPEEAERCRHGRVRGRTFLENPNATETEPVTSPSRLPLPPLARPFRSSARHAHLIVDFCRFHWRRRDAVDVFGEAGDFRSDVYSLGVVGLASARVEIGVDFDSGVSAADRRRFRECRQLPEKLEEAAAVVKWTVDEIVKDVEENDDDDDDDDKGGLLSNFPPPKPVDPPLPSPPLPSDNVSACEPPSPPRPPLALSPGLNPDSVLCFVALRPDDPLQQEYLETPESEPIVGDAYRLADICVGFGTRLRDERAAEKKEAATDQRPWAASEAALRRRAAARFETSVNVFRFCFLIFTLAFAPLIFLKVYPSSQELRRFRRADRMRVNDDDDENVENLDEERWVRVEAGKLRQNAANLEERLSGTHSSQNKEATSGISLPGKEMDPNDAPIDASLLQNGAVSNARSIMRPTSVRDATDDAAAADLAADSPDVLPVRRRVRTSATQRARKSLRSFFHFDFETDDDDDDDDRIFVAIDDRAPSVSPLALLSAEPAFGHPCVNSFVSWLRRWALIVLASGHGPFLMAYMDSHVYPVLVDTMMAFRVEHNVTVSDLSYWNFFAYNRWNCFFMFIFLYWNINVAALAVPAVTKHFVESCYYSHHFGLHRLNDDFVPHHLESLDGLTRVSRGLAIRLGLPYRRDFWRFVWGRLRKDWSKARIFMILLSPFSISAGLLSTLPIFALFPNHPFGAELPGGGGCGSRLSNVARRIFAFVVYLWKLSLFVIHVFLLYLTLSIYFEFLVHTLTATIQHFELTLNVLGVIVGFFTFLWRIKSRARNKYLSLQLSVLQTAREIDENEEDNDQGTTGQQKRRALVRYCPQGTPYIPKALHKLIVHEMCHPGLERFKFALKLAGMATLVWYVDAVVKVSNLDGELTAFGAAQAIVTLAVVVVPSVLAGFRSEEEKAFAEEQRRCKIKALIGKFLEEHPAAASTPVRKRNDKAGH